MRKNIITQAWLADFYAEGLKPKFKGTLKQVIHETVPYNDIEEAHKPSSKATEGARPQAKGSSFNPKSTSSRIRDPE